LYFAEDIESEDVAATALVDPELVEAHAQETLRFLDSKNPVRRTVFDTQKPAVSIGLSYLVF